MSQKRQTIWIAEVWMLIPPNIRTALNDRLEVRGFGPDTFSRGLSISGSAPIQAYDAVFPICRQHFGELLWVLDNANASQSWCWIAARDYALRRLKTVYAARINASFEKGAYQDLHWQTRANAYARIGEGPIVPETALRWIRDNGLPSRYFRPIQPVI